MEKSSIYDLDQTDQPALVAHWRLKLLLSVLCSLMFCVPYFLLQNYPLFDVYTLPELFVDRMVGFSMEWVWGYQSAYLLIFGVPWVLRDRNDLVGWLKGYTFLCVSGFVILALAPVSAPRPPVLSADGMYALLLSYDGLVNCMPSLHAALTVFSAAVALCCLQIKSFASVVVLWVGIVLYSTVATKQHYVLDLIPGVVIGYLSFIFARQTFRRKCHAYT